MNTKPPQQFNFFQLATIYLVGVITLKSADVILYFAIQMKAMQAVLSLLLLFELTTL